MGVLTFYSVRAGPAGGRGTRRARGDGAAGAGRGAAARAGSARPDRDGRHGTGFAGRLHARAEAAAPECRPVGTVKLSSKGTEKRGSSLELRIYAAALAPVISAHIAKACARTARYSTAGR